MLVSPAEPKPFYSLGTVSGRTEEYGADFLISSKMFGAVGVQRKEVGDLISSIGDGRVARELVQMKPLGLAVWLIEGKMQWTNGGTLVSHSSFTRAQWQGFTLSVQSMGYWIAQTSSVGESIDWISNFAKWLAKDRHGSLLTRPKSAAKGQWGRADNRDWGIWLLQGFVGIGYQTAAAIYDHFGGVPLQWEVTTEDLMEVAGVGKGRAKELTTALSPASLSTQREQRPESPSTLAPWPGRPTVSSPATTPAASSSRSSRTAKGRSASSPSPQVEFIELTEI